MNLIHLFNQGKYSDIISVFDSRGFNLSSSPEDLQVLAAAYFRIGEFHKALQLLRTLESSLSNKPDYLSLYATTLRRLGFLDEALANFEKALALDSSNIQIKNNYSNLLIDLNKFHEAKIILDKILLENPDYQDALANRDRLVSLQSKQSISEQSTQKLDLGDPLLLAFEQDEVNYSDTRYFPKGRSTNAALEELPELGANSVVDDYLEAARKALSENNYDLSFKLCSQAHSIKGPSVDIFDCVADIYFSQKNFVQAEIYTLHALALGCRSLKSFFNMASFASIKCDYALANYYLDMAEAVDRSAPQIKATRETIQQQIKLHPSPFNFVEPK